VVCLSVDLSVCHCHDREPYKNGLTDRDADWDMDSGGPKECPDADWDVLDGSAHWYHLANATEPSVCVGDAALCQITLTTCCFYFTLLLSNLLPYFALIHD